MDFAFPAGYRVKIRGTEKINIYVDFVRERKKSFGHEDDEDKNCRWYVLNSWEKLDEL